MTWDTLDGATRFIVGPNITTRATAAPKLFILSAIKIAASAPSECPMIMIGLYRFFADVPPGSRVLHSPDDRGRSRWSHVEQVFGREYRALWKKHRLVPSIDRCDRMRWHWRMRTRTQ